jgi:hypothetical protein
MNLPQKELILNQQLLLHRIANRIRQSLELNEILNAMVAEVRTYLGTDRIKVYQFSPDGSGVVIAESLAENQLPSLMGLHFPADDIPLYARELFVRARQRSIVDLTSHEIGISPLHSNQTGEASEKQDIRYRPVDPCHVEYLTAMGVKSSVVVPIVLESRETGVYQPPSLDNQAQLWGLLISHHSQPRQVTEEELQFIQAVVDQVSVAIAQSILLEKVRAQAQQEANLNRIISLLYSTPTVKLQAALEEAVTTFNGSGGRLYLLADSLPREIYTCGTQPEVIDPEKERPIEENRLWQKYIHSVIKSTIDKTSYQPWTVEWMRSVYNMTQNIEEVISPQVWAVNDLYREPLFRTLAPFFQFTKIRSILIIPLRYDVRVLGCLTIFRDEIDTEILWAGYHNPDTRQMMARQSFDVWREIKSSQTQPWTKAEIKYAEAIGERFSTAIQHYHLYHQIQSLNTTLEQQVQTRTEELQSVIQQQDTLSQILTKIRESLEIEIIFKTTGEELIQLLQVEEVTFHQFNSDNNLKFVSSVMGITQLQISTSNNSYLEEIRVDKNHYQEIVAINNIYEVGYTTEQIQLLDKFQLKSLIVAPIFVAQHLWGLLGIYQHTCPRHWKTHEIEFIERIAAQLGVAVQQAELLGTTKQQAEQLSDALDKLKNAQAQLIQTEKMSSLGQLVAGIAHEINNPINFISGNIHHISEYTQNLINLISCYQEYYQMPPELLERKIKDIDLDFVVTDLPNLCNSLRMGAERISKIVKSLRTFARFDESEIKEVNIHDGIESTLLILQHRLQLEDGEMIEIVKNFGELPLVECFAGKLNQVIMNLIENAIDELQVNLNKDMKKTIIISTQELKLGWVQISIKDNGKGIPENIKSKIFDPFFTTKPIGKGIGLGLAVGYGIIEQHGGRLYCYSEVNEGTEFLIELPVKISK